MAALRTLSWLGIAASLLLSACAGEEAEPGRNGEPVAGEETRYVGDEACATCHGDIYLTYHRTGMGASMSTFDPNELDIGLPMTEPVYDAGNNFYYESFSRNDTLFQREYRLDDGGDVVYERIHPVEWVIGSGHATRSFLMNVKGYVTEMPLTWYVGRQLWDLSPGYRQNNMRFSRPIAMECMTCHNGFAEKTPFTQAHYTEVPVGITCERCHGPGGEHVESRLAGFSPGGEDDATIVNPADLSRSRQLSICQQCHLTGVTVLKPGETFTSFRPGMLISAHRSVFVTKEQVEDRSTFRISSHALRLAQSACFRNSDMTCTTCHNPHEPVAELGSDYFNATCATCHAQPELRASFEAPETRSLHTASANCVDCHMPKSGTSDIPHVVFTDHWIRATDESYEPSPGRSPLERRTREEPFELVRVVGDSTQSDPNAQMALEKAVAYFMFYERNHPAPDYLDRVTTLARDGAEAGDMFFEVKLRLGRALIEQDSLIAAERVLEETVEQYPENAYAHYWLGTARKRGGHTRLAQEAFSASWRIQPAFIEAGIALADVLSTTGDHQEAIRVLRDVLRRNPAHYPRGWNNLGFAYLQTRQLSEAEDALETALQLEPDLAVALVNLGSVHLLLRQWDAAIEVLTRATVIDPDYAAAYGNLGVAYARSGRAENAREAFERLLAINPNDRRARAYLQQLPN